VTGPPKSAAGLPTVSLCAMLVPELERHLEIETTGHADGPLFPGPGGAPFR